MRLAGIEENALGRRGLTRVDMRHDTEVSVFMDFMNARHRTNSFKGSEKSPAIMREGAVRLRHPVRVFPLLHRVAAIVGSIHKLR